MEVSVLHSNNSNMKVSGIQTRPASHLPLRSICTGVQTPHATKTAKELGVIGSPK